MRTLIINLALYLIFLWPIKAQTTELVKQNKDKAVTLSHCEEAWPDTWRKHEVCTNYQAYAWADSVSLITRSSLLNWTIGSFNFSGTLKYIVPPAEELAFNLIIINPLGDTVYNRMTHYPVIGENWSFVIGFLQYVYTDETIILYNPFPGLYTMKSIIKATQFTDHTVTLNFAIDSPVPVELTYFTAKLSDNEVKLSWATATEINNYGFLIERQAINESYINIGFVPGSGNSNSPQAYTFIDKLIIPNKYLYRLKQLDLDGSYDYSNCVEILFNPPDNFSLWQNYPNPFNPATVLTYSLPEPQQVRLVVYNTLGEEMAILHDGYQLAGTHQINFLAQGLAGGIYFYRLTAGEFSETKQMIILK